ncbi:hypothetical protein [Phytohabitans suffuscus]|uniref:Uncharacterized protein n=1 Tax=Phytohabitans suffuscus TaxID=624315 RepID=A0A6F8YUS6_9ACTN|nr:hypothetical protein [Phytohabitans suffuscus]BCB89806.1 hypothetical protein Psuf_071190 [Phytohabitans suffuscus]
MGQLASTISCSHEARAAAAEPIPQALATGGQIGRKVAGASSGNDPGGFPVCPHRIAEAHDHPDKENKPGEFRAAATPALERGSRQQIVV